MATKSVEHLTRNGAALAVVGALAAGAIFALLEGAPDPSRGARPAAEMAPLTSPAVSTDEAYPREDGADEGPR